MAKHTKGKKLSKGSRISCKPLASKHPANAVDVKEYPTAMRQAFGEASIQPMSQQTRNVVAAVLNKGAGLIKTGRGWTANVSQRTLKALQSAGVFA